MKIVGTKLFKKWLYTYLFLISVSLVFIYSIHTIYDRSMKEDLSKLNRAYIEQIANFFDDEFRSLDQMVYTIGLDSQFNNLINMNKELSTRNRYEIRSIVRNLDLFSRSNRAIEKIDLYAYKPMLYIGESSVYFDKLINLYTENYYGIPASTYQKLKNQRYSQKVLRLKDWGPARQGYNPLIYLQTLPIQYQSNPKGFLMIVINEKKLESFGGKELLPNGKLFVFNNENKLIYSNDKDAYQSELPIDQMIKVDLVKFKLMGLPT